MSGHLSMRPTWTSPSRVDGPAWPCTGRGLPGRRVTATPVRSYRTISPLPVRDSRVAAPSAVYFCGTFPRVSPGGRYPPPCPVVSGLSSRGFLSPRGPLGPPIDGSHRPRIGQAGAGYGGEHADGGACTGAGGGLGRAIAVELAGRGFVVWAPTSMPRRRRDGGRDRRRRQPRGPRRPRRGGLPGARRDRRRRGGLARPLGQQRRRPRHRHRLGAGRGDPRGDARDQRRRHDERDRRGAGADDRRPAAAT